MYTAMYGHLELAQYLLDRGAALAAVDNVLTLMA